MKIYARCACCNKYKNNAIVLTFITVKDIVVATIKIDYFKKFYYIYF